MTAGAARHAAAKIGNRGRAGLSRPDLEVGRVQPDLQYIVHPNTDRRSGTRSRSCSGSGVVLGRYTTEPLRLHPCNRVTDCGHGCAATFFIPGIYPKESCPCAALPLISGARRARRLRAGEAVCASAAAAGSDCGDGPQGSGAGPRPSLRTHIAYLVAPRSRARRRASSEAANSTKAPDRQRRGSGL